MNLSATLILAFGMSMDAFAASIGKGAVLHKPRFHDAIRTGLIFGLIEAITPFIGWALGFFASQYIIEWDHWVAFTLLVILGGRMIMQGISSAHNEDDEPVRHHDHGDTGHDDWPLYRSANGKKGGNLWRCRVDWYWQQYSLRTPVQRCLISTR